MTSARTSGRVLARNTAFNAAGQLLPLLLALPVLPFVLGALGAERFALLTLAWTLIGYFGFLDLGLGRAATRYVAGALASGDADEVSRIVWSALGLQLLLAIVGAAALVLLAPLLAADVLRISDPVLLVEARGTIAAVAAGLPLVLLSGTFSGVLEAHQRFDLVNAVRIPANVAMLAIPAAGAAAGLSLPVIVGAIVAARACALIGFAVLSIRTSGGLPLRRPDRVVLRRLLSFGGWLSVSLLAVPIFTYAERFLIGGLRSLTELAFYAIPFEIVARTAVLPAAVAFTLFPAFSFAHSHPDRVAALFHKPVRLLFLVQWPVLVLFWLFAPEILRSWLSEEAATAGAGALRLLALAFFLNGFAQIALAGVQGLGRPDLKARLDLIQLPLYGVCAVFFIARFGITGAAAAKLLFTITDSALLFIFARRLGAPPLVERSVLAAHPLGAAAVTALIAATAVAVVAPLSVRIAVALAGVSVLTIAMWRLALEPSDRAALRALFSRSALNAATP
jgi:O-antigen/teichoic acid export membrane protein